MIKKIHNNSFDVSADNAAHLNFSKKSSNGNHASIKSIEVMQMGESFDASYVSEFRSASNDLEESLQKEEKRKIYTERMKMEGKNEKMRMKEAIKEMKKDDRMRKRKAFLGKFKYLFKGRRREYYFDKFSLLDVIRASEQYLHKKEALSFVAIFSLVLVLAGGIALVNKGVIVKGKVLGVSKSGYESMTQAISDVSNQDFESSGKNFAKAYEDFSYASLEVDQMGNFLVKSSRFIPFASKLSSGKYMLEAAKNLSSAGVGINKIIKSTFETKENALEKNSDISFLTFFKENRENISSVKKDISSAIQNIDKVKVNDLPEEDRSKFVELENRIPFLLSILETVEDNSSVIVDVLGGNGPRKYLFLFQNNNEMRATGGFIGSYGLLEISNGKVRNFLIEGIFNPDGQLKEKIVPPTPIKKISEAWSLHDSNWFPDFPTSAEKAMEFYELTGGPTVDGVITFTPIVMQKLLDVTGPVYMEEYGVTLDSSNFIEKTQFEVEEDYDKKENKPKKILSDLAPIVIEKVVNSNDPGKLLQAAEVFSQSLAEKHVLLYSENKNLQETIESQGWSGKLLETKKDYLSVINSNINGYKTDGVIDEQIKHEARVLEDGKVRVSLEIIRKHNGGDTPYEWWNKVNADYMRVYVPLGSKLLEASGYTRETIEDPLDYNALGFERDSMIELQERGISVDSVSGTRIYEENGKTVFANWTYVSPKEEVVIKYVYELPFTLFSVDFDSNEKIDSYSLLAQKQSGSKGSDFISRIIFDDKYEGVWFSENLENEGNKVELTSSLDIDRFIGVVLKKK